MSLPSQVGRTPGKGPRAEVSRPRPKPWIKPVAVLSALVLVGLAVWASVALLGRPATEPPTAAVPAEPEVASGADPAMDAILGGGQPSGRGSSLLDESMTQAQRPSAGADDGALAPATTATTTPLPDPAMDIVGQVPTAEPEDAADPGEPEAGPALASADGDLAGLGSVARTGAEEAIEEAERLVGQGRALAARDELNGALVRGDLPANAQQRLRDRLTTLNDTLVFGSAITPGDDIAGAYTVKSGDSLARIAAREGAGTHWKLIARVNGIADPTKIRVGQKLKVVRGPFHAVVDKSDFRLDVFQGPPETPAEWVYVTSMPVGLGAGDGTPLGTFVVSAGKLENPGWVNPRDRTERYERDDPKNPIGEHWIGLTGVGESSVHEGYGLHGTIEPGSIGKTMSMGCVRLGDDDVALLYELLGEGGSVVHIVP